MTLPTIALTMFGGPEGWRYAVALSGLTGAILDLNASAAEAASESVAAFSAASTSMADVFTAFDAAAERRDKARHGTR